MGLYNRLGIHAYSLIIDLVLCWAMGKSSVILLSLVYCDFFILASVDLDLVDSLKLWSAKRVGYGLSTVCIQSIKCNLHIR